MIDTGADTVARKKIETSEKPRKSVDFGEPKSIIVAIRGSKEFKDWLYAYAQRQRSTTAQIVERALALQAQRDGESPPPKR